MVEKQDRNHYKPVCPTSAQANAHLLEAEISICKAVSVLEQFIHQLAWKSGFYRDDVKKTEILNRLCHRQSILRVKLYENITHY